MLIYKSFCKIINQQMKVTGIVSVTHQNKGMLKNKQNRIKVPTLKKTLIKNKRDHPDKQVQKIKNMNKNSNQNRKKNLNKKRNKDKNKNLKLNRKRNKSKNRHQNKNKNRNKN